IRILNINCLKFIIFSFFKYNNICKDYTKRTFLVQGKKIAIILSGFQKFYLEKLKSLLFKENYQMDFYTNNKKLLADPNTYFFDSEISETDPEIIEKLNLKLEEAMRGQNYDLII